MPSADPNLVVNAHKNNPFILKFLGIVFVVLAILFLIHLLLQKIRTLHSSAAWIEAQKNKETTFQNVKAVAKTASLTNEERNLLWDMCSKYKAKNIEYLVRDGDAIKDLLLKEYNDIGGEEESVKTVFFQLHFKLEKARYREMFITTTGSLAVGQEFSYKDADGFEWKFRLAQNSPQGMFLEVPSAFIKSGKAPAQLAKFVLMFDAKNGVSYTLLTRVIRYSEDKNGKNILVASSTDQVKPILRRASKRMVADFPCKFSSAKPNGKKKGQMFDIQEKKYDGIMQDISATGCRISCDMPIKQGQFLFIEFSLNGAETQSAVGSIVVTKKASVDNKYILHIKFEEIEAAAKNKIYALIHGYMAKSK